MSLSTLQIPKLMFEQGNKFPHVGQISEFMLQRVSLSNPLLLSYQALVIIPYLDRSELEEEDAVLKEVTKKKKTNEEVINPKTMKRSKCVVIIELVDDEPPQKKKRRKRSKPS